MNGKRPFAVYWYNAPSPYLVDRFNALVDRGSIEFEAWFSDRIEPGRSWAIDEGCWRFRHRYLPKIVVLGTSWHWPAPLLRGRQPDVLVSGYASPVWMLGWALAKVRGVKTGFRVLATYDKWFTRHPVKELAKNILFRYVDFIETPGEDGRQYAMTYGAPSERIFFAPHTVQVAESSAAAARMRAEREVLRRELGVAGTTFIYVGRLWWGKGLTYLLRAFERVQRASAEEVSLLLVGDGPEERALVQECEMRGLRNVIFAGFKQREELPLYYAVSDVFVFPTLGDPYGLAVDEAMACSLPVISTSAAGEIRSRVEDGVTGFVVPPEDSDALAERMLEMVNEPSKRERMGQLSADRVAGHTPERWAEAFENMVRVVLNGDVLQSANCVRRGVKRSNKESAM